MWGIAHIINIYEWEYVDVFLSKKGDVRPIWYGHHWRPKVTIVRREENKVYSCFSFIYMYHFKVGSILKKNKNL